MPLPSQRYLEVDEQLQQVQAMLAALAGELGQALSAADQVCQPCQAAMKVANQVADLRYLLVVAEARRQISEGQALAGGCIPSLTNPSATAPLFLGVNLPAFKWFRLDLDDP